MKLIELLLTLNAAASLLFFIVNIRKGDKMFLALFFMALPILGILLYTICAFMEKNHESPDYDREYLVNRYIPRREAAEVDMEQAMGIAPLEDVLNISDKFQRRNMLLSGLKKGVSENYKNYLAASDNEDSETAHYIASAKLAVFRELYEKFSVCAENQKDEPNPQNEKALLLSIQKLIDSELLSRQELIMYRMLFCDSISETSMKDREILEAYMEALRLLHRGDELETIWNNIPKEQKSEGMYMNMLNLYYSKSEEKKFLSCMDELKNSRIIISSEGLSTLRFWESEGRT